MNHSENLEYKKLLSELRKIKEENDMLNKEIKIITKKEKDNSNIIIDLQKDIEKSNRAIKTLTNDNCRVKYTQSKQQLEVVNNIVKEKEITIEELKKKVKCLEKQLAKYQVREKKDSSNSSKPSSTNAFKKVVTNNREKSNKKQGGQIGHKGTGLTKEKLENLMKQKNVEVTVIEVNKTTSNSNKKPEIRAVVDIKIVKTVTLYKYYPNEKGNYSIPEEHNCPVQYGSKIKALAVELMVGSNNSTDATKSIISSITDLDINLSKGTLVNWMNSCAKKLEPQLSKIVDNLLEAYYMNDDESQIIINGQRYNTICACNDKYVKLWISKNKSKEAIDNLNFLIHYTGIIIKDGTSLYNSYGKALSQCVAHIMRYLKGVYEFNGSNGSKLMRDFLKEVLKLRQELIEDGKESFDKITYARIIERFDKIFKSWKKEWMSSTIESNVVYEEERKLLARFEDSKERKEILYFLTDFKIPATNNQAESSLRPIKIKQKIGKFRSVKGAEDYADIKSCNLTYKKHNIPTFEALVKLFDNQLILV